MSIQLSIVIATLNRVELLEAFLDSILRHTQTGFETIIVDGGSVDATEGMLEGRRTFGKSLHLIQQGERLGAVKAYNAGFAAARGEFVAHFNDDCLIIHDETIDWPVRVLQATPSVAQVIIPFQTPTMMHPKIDVVTLRGEQIPYANFGVTRRADGDRVGWWGTRYYHYAGDSELTVKLVNIGKDIHYFFPIASKQGEGSEQSLPIMHLEVHDDTRVENDDSAAFYDRWRDWDGAYDHRFLMG